MKKYLLLSLILLGTSTAFAQRGKLNIALGGGADYYVGDLKDNTLPDPRYLHLFGTIQLNYQIKPWVMIGGGYLRGKLSGADAIGPKNKLRDFYFESKLRDYHLHAKWNLNNWYDNYYKYTPRIYTGVGYFRFDPMVDGVAVRTLGTEGQLLGGDYPKPYKPWSIALKIGPEIVFPINNWLDIDVYCIYNNTFTDHIDDVGGKYPAYEDLVNGPGGASVAAYTYRYPSGFIPRAGANRGNPKMRDGYIYFGANLSIWPYGKGRRGYRIDCPDPDKFRNPMLERESKKEQRKNRRKNKETRE